MCLYMYVYMVYMHIYRCTSVSACVSLSAPTYWGQAEVFARLAFLLDTGFGSTRVLSDKGFCVQGFLLDGVSGVLMLNGLAWLGLSRPNLACSQIWLGGSAHTYIGIHTCGTKTRRGREGIIALQTYVAVSQNLLVCNRAGAPLARQSM